MSYIITLEHKIPSPDINEVYSLGRPFLVVFIFFPLNLSDQCLSVDMKRRRNIAYSQHEHAPAHEPCPAGI